MNKYRTVQVKGVGYISFESKEHLKNKFLYVIYLGDLEDR